MPIVPGLHGLRRDMGDVRERLARLGGMFDVFARRDRRSPARHDGRRG